MERSQTETPRKDKRLLVLLFLLAVALLPHALVPAAPQPYHYLALEQKGTAGPQLERLPASWSGARIAAWLRERTGLSESMLLAEKIKKNELIALPGPDAGAGGERLVDGRLLLFFAQPVPINRADAATLEMLPGIGPVLARRIVDFRERRVRQTGSRLSSLRDLQDIPGIGPALTQKLTPYLSFE